jgi:hypothetical protein
MFTDKVDLGSKRRMDVSLGYGYVLDGVHQGRDADILRTSLVADIAGGTEPDKVAG